MRREIRHPFLLAGAFALTAFALCPALAHGQGASPPPAPTRDATVLRRPAPAAPAPPRPTGTRASERPPTPPVVLPMPAASPPPVVETRAEAVTPPPLERPAQRSIAASAPVVAERSVNVREAPPAGSTGRCKDGTYLTGTPSAARCDDRGGLAVVFPTQAAPQVRRP